MTLIEPDVRPLRDVALSDKYDLERGRIFCSGVQAVARLPFDQRRADARAGLNTGGFVSGYQGSPLGGIDKELARLTALLDRWNVHFQPGLNEELAATSVVGTQIVPARPGATVEGVTGWWYGKNPGLDRAADAIRHGTFQGASPKGGMVLWVGDDPGCKSSTLPSAAEATLAALHVPVLYPSSVQEVLDLGLHAVAMSRASGLWSALKIVTSVADSAGTAEVAPERIAPVVPEVEWMGRPFVHQPNAMLLAPDSMALEQSLLHVRLDVARAYAHANGLDVVEGARGEAWLGIVAAGRTYRELRSALALLGFDDAALERRGIRLLHVRMPWPLDGEALRAFVDGLEEIVVVEEKLPFMEEQIKHLLYRTPDAPQVVGKRDESGRALLHPEGELLADEIALAIAGRARRRISDEGLEACVASIEAASRYMARPLPMARTPYFCSGCPHNTSMVAPDGALVGGGIGCHTMIVLNREGKGDIAGITQMGGEGAQWIGMAPFVADEHLTQNLGDGTFHHSGSLAVRASVAAGTNITYKLLYNGFVSMTGGQDIEGQLSVPDLTRWLALEGVARVIVTTEDPGRYRGVALDPIAEVRDRSEIDAAQRELAAIPGTTVLIHDQVCAAEKRRLTKRGKIAPPAFRVAINERVCEGCGDCGRKSSCLSVVPTDTEFGRKTMIHQASCNTDFSCLEGDCPSFLTVIPAKGAAPAATRRAPAPPTRQPAPEAAPATSMIRMIGIGGTGVVTVSQILAMAAHLDGLEVASLDQTGLAQKGGPVVSDVLISDRPITGTNRAAPASVDAYLAFDALGGADAKNLRTASPERTTAVVSTSVTATGAVVTDVNREMPAVDLTLDRIDRHTRRDRNVHLDAQALSQALFADHMPANAIVLGAAFQRGLLPVSEAALTRAFELNGAAVEKNLAAFAWGRAVVADPDAIAAVTPAPVIARTLDEIVALRVRELTDYQDAAYAARFSAIVDELRAAEAAAGITGTRFTEAAAKGLFKLMAYKDEYEVARLHLDPVERARVEEQFGPGARVQVNLHPPMLRAMGLDHKLKFGRWFDPGFKTLYRMRRLRGTRWDPFGRAEVRRVERALVEEHIALLRFAASRLSEGTLATCTELAALPDVVRGYEEIKLAGVARYHEQAAALRASLA
jgi:indolepyruvate ferredoxin oxidoreductase